jgi:electron-transferring-flavoprotein dehydrogenase
VPKLTFPGGLLVGDTAGFLNVPKIKGTHMAMKSGMVAAEAVFAHLAKDDAGAEATRIRRPAQAKLAVGRALPGTQHPSGLQVGPVGRAGLRRHRHLRLQGQGAVDLHHHADHTQLGNKAEHPKIAYPKPDGVLTFDRLSSVFLSATNHEENQPCHLRLKDESVAISVNYAQFGAPETRYCPAGVYEILGEEEGKPRLQINGQNCLHCKTCDIKDPTQNIDCGRCRKGAAGRITQICSTHRAERGKCYGRPEKRAKTENSTTVSLPTQ